MTEPEYLRAFGRKVRNQLVEVEITGGHGVPKTLVEKATARKKQAEKEARRRGDDNLKYDEVWCVFDVDQHPNLPEAKIQARDYGIRLAISNPSFELWLLLHFQDHTAWIHRDDVCRLLRCPHLPAYDKHVNFERLAGAYEEAVRRALALEKRHASASMAGANPSTDVHRLTERIRLAAK